MFRLQWSTQNIPKTHQVSKLSPNFSDKGLMFLVAPRAKPTTFFHNTSMLLRIDPRLNNTKCMSCGMGAL
jgi:hypothetical protein